MGNGKMIKGWGRGVDGQNVQAEASQKYRACPVGAKLIPFHDGREELLFANMD